MEPENQFRRVDNPANHHEEPMGAILPIPEIESPSPNKWHNPVLIGLGVLLVIGGIALGFNKKDSSVELVELPDYTPTEVSPSTELVALNPADSPSNETAPNATNPINSPSSPTSSVLSASPTIKPAIKASPTNKVNQQKVAVNLDRAKPALKPIANNLPVKTADSLSGLEPTSVATPLPDFEPIYQAVVPLTEYQPQFNQPVASPSQNLTVKLVIAGQVYEVAVSQSTTVSEVMRLALSQDLTYELKAYSFGSLVTSINGQNQGNGNYWTFKKNGIFSSLGIDQQTVNPGDKIEWSLTNA